MTTTPSTSTDGAASRPEPRDRQGRLRQPDRHRRRVVRLLPLRLGRGPRLRHAVLPRQRPRPTARCSRSCTYALGFAARPLGGIVFGHFGDKIGRKKMLVVSLLMMGIATFAIGLLPTYATIGVAAPLLLIFCRLVQGFALGGEWGGAVLIVAEHGDDSRARLLGVVAAGRRTARQPARHRRAVGAGRLPVRAAFLDWGWRIPFLLSAVLVLIGLWVRLTIEESPVFTEAQRRGEGTRPHADRRGDQGVPARGPHRHGHADGREHQLLHLHVHLDHLRRRTTSAWTRTSDPQGAADRRDHPVLRGPGRSAPCPTGSAGGRCTSPAPSASGLDVRLLHPARHRQLDEDPARRSWSACCSTR